MVGEHSSIWLSQAPCVGVKWKTNRPQVFYNHHQTAPFPARIWIPPFAEPVSSNVHPLMWRWVNLYGTAMAAYLDERDMPGAIHRGTGFDNWYPGFIDNVHSFRGTVAFLTETALYRYATPHFYTLSDFPESRRDLRSEVFYASPWEGGWWRLGDAVRYMIGASMSVLDTSARYRESLLYNRYQAGRDAIARFRNGPPYAYLIPERQWDPSTAGVLVEKLMLNGLEVHAARAPFEHGGLEYGSGTRVVRMDQPFAPLVFELFEVQEYPDLRVYEDGPPDLPYDVAGWTLPLQMGVEVVEVLAPLDESLLEGLALLEEPPRGTGRVRGSGDAYVLSSRPNANARALNRLLARGAAAHLLPGERETAAGAERGAVHVGGLERDVVRAVAAAEGLQLLATGEGPGEDAIPLGRSRVAVFQPTRPSIDEGWTRWLLDEFDFDYHSLSSAEVRAGHLGRRFDVLVIPSMGRSSIVDGFRPGTVPPEYAGGVGERGLQNLRRFVEGGGTLVTFDRACRFAVEELNLPVVDTLEDLETEEFFCIGSLLAAEVGDRSHPLLAGLPEEVVLMFDGGAAYETRPGFRGTRLVTYAEHGDPLRSGFLVGPDRLQGRAAALEVASGEGRVVLLGFRPQWRGQPHGTFKLIFNALRYTDAVADRVESSGEPANPALERWGELERETGAELERLIGATRDWQAAGGGERETLERALSAALNLFREERLGALDDFRTGLEDARAAERVRAYNSGLKRLLVDLRSKDFTVVEYSAAELLEAYGIPELERAVRDALAQ